MAAVISKGAALLAVPALMGAFAGTAAADTNAAAEAVFIPANVADFSDCPAGFVCFYTGPNGTGSKCQWQSADANHIPECSWAGDTNFASVYNNGTSAEFIGVCSYSRPDFDTAGRVLFVPQGLAGNTAGDYKSLSHKWIRKPAC